MERSHPSRPPPKQRQRCAINTRENMGCANCPQAPSVSAPLSSSHVSSRWHGAPACAAMVQLSLSRLNHWLPWGQAHPHVMQGATACHHQIADTLLPQADPVFDDAAALLRWPWRTLGNVGLSKGGGTGRTDGDREGRTGPACVHAAAHVSCRLSPGRGQTSSGVAPRPAPPWGSTEAASCGHVTHVPLSSVPQAPS